MVSIQDAVLLWHARTFGAGTSPERIVRTSKKTLEEAAELYCEARNPKYPGSIAEEIADVAITCFSLASMCGVDLEQQIRYRLEQLEARTDQRARDAERGICMTDRERALVALAEADMRLYRLLRSGPHAKDDFERLRDTRDELRRAFDARWPEEGE